jgi:hypothetical protein
VPEKNYRIPLDDENVIFVYVETVQVEVTAFVVKYLSMIDGEEIEILRYDSGHNCPHIDVLDSDGETKEKVWLNYLSNAQALTFARDDIERNYLQYRERFLQWKNK